jgi:protein phosphatase
MTENNFQIDSAAISDRGLSEKRLQNEDSYLELNEQGLFAVADGVGGAQAGDVASQMAVEVLGEAFINLQKNGDAEEMMKIAIERANEAIFQMSHDLEQLSTMATTIVALHVSGNIATIGHVGDSRLYRLDPKGDFFRETEDHSVVEEEVRAGRMTAAQALNHPSKNIISRALGAEQSVVVDMKTTAVYW